MKQLPRDSASRAVVPGVYVRGVPLHRARVNNAARSRGVNTSHHVTVAWDEKVAFSKQERRGTATILSKAPLSKGIHRYE